MAVWKVRQDEVNPCRGRFVGHGIDVPCVLGRSGLIPRAEKQEGDGYTPEGQYPFRKVFYRADKLVKPSCKLPTQQILKVDGWCDAPMHASYNQHVTLPFDASHERLWRDDNIYDLILVIGHNDTPVEPEKGSAVFLHVAREGFTPTEGCVAFEKNTFLEILRRIEAADILQIGTVSE